jgi:acetyltransferase-like isoleucine patch superfamily enzyme
MGAPMETIGRDIFVHAQALVESKAVGAGTRIWAFAHVMEGARVGENCNIGDHAFIEAGASVGNGVTVKNGVSIWDRVTVEDHVFLGPNCVLTNDPNPRAAIRKSHDQLVSTLIRAHASIGANATIVCGVTVGRFAFIGAGSVVTRSVPDFALMVGNPARQTAWVCLCAQKLGLAVKPQPGAFAHCKSCGCEFMVTAEGIAVITDSALSIAE